MKHKFIFLVFLLLLLISNVAYAEEISKAEEMIKDSFPNAQKIAEIDIGAKEISGEVKNFEIAANTGDVIVGVRDTKSIGNTIYYFDRDGNELWNYATKENLANINIAKNGGSVCAYYSTGEIGTDDFINRVFDRSGNLQYENVVLGHFRPAPDGEHFVYGRSGFQIYDLKGNPIISNPLITDDCIMDFISDNKLLVCKFHGFDKEGFSKEFKERKVSHKELLEKYTTSPPKILLFEYPSLNLLWEYTLEKRAAVRLPSIAYNGNILVTRSGRMLLCFDKNGNLLWEKKINFFQGVTISDDGNYVLATTQNMIFVLSSKTGEILLEKQFLGTTIHRRFGYTRELSFVDGEILISGLVIQSYPPYRYKGMYKCSISEDLDFIEGELKNVCIRGLSLNFDKDTQFIGTMITDEDYQKIELFENKIGDK